MAFSHAQTPAAMRLRVVGGALGNSPMEQLKSALAEYISTIEASAAKSHQAEDRSRYQQHLAAAALMYAALEKHRSIEKLKEIVASERHSYGWDYLYGSEGKAAEAAFNAFAKLVETTT